MRLRPALTGLPSVLPVFECRKCGAANPMVYFAPVVIDAVGTCICFDCAESRLWLDRNGDLRHGIEL